MNIRPPIEVIQAVILSQDYFPGNPYYPLLIYRQVFSTAENSKTIQNLLKQNGWCHVSVRRNTPTKARHHRSCYELYRTRSMKYVKETRGLGEVIKGV